MRTPRRGHNLAIHLPTAGKRPFETGKTPANPQLLSRLRKFRGRLPADFRFDRLEANEESH